MPFVDPVHMPILHLAGTYLGCLESKAAVPNNHLLSVQVLFGEDKTDKGLCFRELTGMCIDFLHDKHITNTVRKR